MSPRRLLRYPALHSLVPCLAPHCPFMLSILWTINHYHPHHHHHYIMVIIIIIIIIIGIIIIIIRVVLSCVMVLLVLVCSPGVLVSGRKRRNQ